MSISAINAAVTDSLGPSGQMVNTTLHYIDGGRIQLIASTLIDPAGKRQTLLRPFVGNADIVAGAKGMIEDWKSGALAGLEA